MNPRTYRATLSLPGVPTVTLFAFLGRLAFGIIPFAVTITFAKAHGFGVAGIAAAALMLAIAVLGPARGRLVDRHGPRLLIVLAATSIVLLCLTAAFADRAPWPFGVILAALGGAAMPPISGAVRTSWARVVPDDSHLQRIHAIDSVAEEATFIIAPLLTTLGLHLLPAPWCLAIGSLFLAPSALGLARHSGKQESSAGSAGLKPVGRARGILGLPAIQGIVLPVLALGAVGGGLTVLLPACAARSGDIASSGYAFAVFSVGGVAGTLVYGRLKLRGTLRTQYVLVAACLTAGTAILIPSITTDVLLPAIFLSGVAMSPLFVIAYLLINERIGKDRHTEANTWVGSSYNLGSAAGSVLLGLLLTHVTVTLAAVVLAAISSVGVVGALRLPRSAAKGASADVSEAAAINTAL